MSGFKGFKREASDLAEELQSYCKDQFESWVSEMMTAIDDPKLPLRYSLGCHCCNIMYVGLQYLRVTLFLRVEAYNTYVYIYIIIWNDEIQIDHQLKSAQWVYQSFE